MNDARNQKEGISLSRFSSPQVDRLSCTTETKALGLARINHRSTERGHSHMMYTLRGEGREG